MGCQGSEVQILSRRPNQPVEKTGFLSGLFLFLKCACVKLAQNTRKIHIDFPSNLQKNTHNEAGTREVRDKTGYVLNYSRSTHPVLFQISNSSREFFQFCRWPAWPQPSFPQTHGQKRAFPRS